MIVVTVPEMACRRDVRTVSACVADVDGVVALQVDPEARTVQIEGDVSVEAIRTAVAGAGFAVT